MSNNLDITVYDFEKVCRTCLSRKDLRPLYEKCSSSTCLVDMLVTCTIVKFTEDDGLPVKICTNCIQEINQAFAFAKRCETIDAILRKCVENIETALTNDLPQSQSSIIEVKEEMQIDIKPEMILSYALVEEDKQEKDIQIEYVEVKREMDVKIEYEDPDETNSTNSQIEEDGFSNLSCYECFENFPDFQTLKKHEEETNHPRNNYNTSCPVCNKVIGRRWMKRHLVTHSGEKPYSCEICRYSFSQNSSLIRHKQVRHSQPNDPMYNCETCGNSFKRLDLLKAHQRREKANLILSKDFHCTKCDQAFTTERLLQQHSIIHGEKKFSCIVCEKEFVSKGLLYSHSKVHMAVRPYACQTCGKGFSKLGHLITHELIHTGEKPNVCSVCSKAFTHPTSLKYHMRIHTGEKPYSCAICSKTFAQPTHLKYHMRIHTGEKPYSCDVCGKSFVMNYHLTHHKETHKRNT